jgi:hypothetical protein
MTQPTRSLLAGAGETQSERLVIAQSIGSGCSVFAAGCNEGALTGAGTGFMCAPNSNVFVETATFEEPKADSGSAARSWASADSDFGCPSYGNVQMFDRSTA